MPTPPPGFYFFVAIFWLVVACTILMVLFKVAVWWGERTNMSTRNAVPDYRGMQWEQRSYAAERPTEHAGTGVTERVPELAEQIGALSDDELLDILARVVDEDGEPRFAESKIGRFIGGRLEDRIAQVRDVRGIETQPKPPTQRVTPIVGRPTNAKYVGAE